MEGKGGLEAFEPFADLLFCVVELTFPVLESLSPFTSVTSLGGLSFRPSNQPSILPASFLVFGDCSSRISKASTRSGDLPVAGLFVPCVGLDRACAGAFLELVVFASVWSLAVRLEVDRLKGFHDFFFGGFSVVSVFLTALSFGAGGACFLVETVVVCSASSETGCDFFFRDGSQDFFV